MCEKSLNLVLSHIFRVALVMEQNISLDPGDVGILSADGIVFEAKPIPDLLQELLWRFIHVI